MFILAWAKGSQRTSQTQLKFLKVNLCITVDVIPTQNGYQLLFCGYMAHIAKEALQILLVTVTVVPVVNGGKGLLEAEVICVFNVSLHLIRFLLQVHFLENDLTKCPFDSHREEVSPMNFVIWPLSCCSPQISVFTGEEHLQEIVIIELIITVKIEIRYQLSEVCWVQFSISVFALELA